MTLPSFNTKDNNQVDTCNNAITSIGLSYSPYVTENGLKRIYIKRYSTGELCVSTHEIQTPDIKESRSKPPINEGSRVVEGLSKRGKSRIRRASNLYDQIQGSNGHKSMITLTYGDTSKSDHVGSKADLDRFIKSLRRYVKKTYDVNDFHYVWVAEIQPKRLKRSGESVIHYHIMTIYNVPYELINKWWNNAVNKPRIKAGLPTQTLHPNVIYCHHAGGYMAKYISKEGHKIQGNGYNMSQATSKGIKPVYENCIDIKEEEIEQFYNGLLNSSRYQTHYTHKEDQTDLHRMMWIAETNHYLFKEHIDTYKAKYHGKTKTIKPSKRSGISKNNQRTKTAMAKAFQAERKDHERWN